MYRILITVCTAVGTAILVTSCAGNPFASARPMLPVHAGTATTQVVPEIDPDMQPVAPTVPAQDNPVNSAATRGGLRTALIITLDIRGQTMSVRNAQILKVPATAIRTAGSADIAVVRDKNNKEVGRAVVPGKTVKIREGHGVVQSHNQVATLAIPLTGKPATIEVQFSGQQPIGPEQVPDVSTDYCKLQPADAICRIASLHVIP